MPKDYFNREEMIGELKEMLTDEQLPSELKELNITAEDFCNAMDKIISYANYWYRKGYEDAKNGGDVN